jgi:hypothetical protein
MNGICKAKWRDVHNTANILLNNAQATWRCFLSSCPCLYCSQH